MPKVTITQAHFAFVDSRGRFTVAVRGDEVDVPTGPEFDRAEGVPCWWGCRNRQPESRAHV